MDSTEARVITGRLAGKHVTVEVRQHRSPSLIPRTGTIGHRAGASFLLDREHDPSIEIMYADVVSVVEAPDPSVEALALDAIAALVRPHSLTLVELENQLDQILATVGR